MDDTDWRNILPPSDDWSTQRATRATEGTTPATTPTCPTCRLCGHTPPQGERYTHDHPALAGLYCHPCVARVGSVILGWRKVAP